MGAGPWVRLARLLIALVLAATALAFVAPNTSASIVCVWVDGTPVCA